MRTVLPVLPPAAAPAEKECILFPRRVQWLMPMKPSNDEKDTCAATASCTFSDTCVSSSYSNDSSVHREEQDFLERSPSQEGHEAGSKTQDVKRSLLLNSTDPAFLPYHIHQQENRKAKKTKGQECQSTVSRRSTSSRTSTKEVVTLHSTSTRISKRTEQKRENCLDTSTSADNRVSKLMFLFSSQKDTCPDRLKELHNIGTQAILLKRTQDYVKVLNESRRLIRFEMALQKRRENLKLECAQRKRTQSFAKPVEGKHHQITNVLHQHHLRIRTTTTSTDSGGKSANKNAAAAQKKENDCAKKPFNAYVAFNPKSFK